MIYQIHGKQIVYDGSECGIYKSPSPPLRMEYAVLDADILVRMIESFPKETAIIEVTKLRDQVAEQTNWKETPQNPGYPVLKQLPPPAISIDEIRGNIKNTENFCNAVLTALKGEE